jgi:hypothetical protein
LEEKQFYLDEDCVVSAFLGEIGWALQEFQGYMRYLKFEVYKDKKFFIMTYKGLFPFMTDFCEYLLPLPEEFYQEGLQGDCYEAVPLDSSPGSLTPPKTYAALWEYFRNFYNREKAIEIKMPRGCNHFINDSCQQIFANYNLEKIESDKPIFVILPRARERASNRNIPEYIWKEVVDALSETNLVVLAGTPNGACLVDYEKENVLNLIRYKEEDKTVLIMRYLRSAICSLSSQSGGTHISLLTGCPSYIIGSECYRHSIQANRLQVPVSFRTLQDYRAIDSETILSDVTNFIQEIYGSDDKDKILLDSIIEERLKNA